MKITMKFLEVMRSIAVIALAAAMVFSMISCDEEMAGTISVKGTPKEGEKLTATSSGTFFGGFSWNYSETKDGSYIPIVGGTAVSGTDNFEFTIPDTVNTVVNLNGKYIKASRISIKGNVYSSAVGPIEATPPTANEITVSGNAKVGEKLTASESSAANTNYTWHYADTNAAATLWTPILGTDLSLSGTNKSELTIPAALLNKYIKVTRMKGLTKIESNVVGPVTNN